MSTFTVIVQNQYPSHRLGEVSAGLQFFRSIGTTVGLAVFGTILNSRFAESLGATLPDQLKGLATDPAMAGQLNNPQVLLSPGAKTQLLQLFGQFGDDAQKLFDLFMAAVRHSLESAISDVFFLAFLISIAGLVVVLFLKEVPLRRTHSEVEDGGAVESAADAGSLPFGAGPGASGAETGVAMAGRRGSRGLANADLNSPGAC